MSVQPKARAAAGLTFIELLVAVTIFAILGAGVVAMFASGVRTWQQVHRIADANQRSRVALQQLSEDWRYAVWVANTEPVLTDKELWFVTRAADPALTTRHRQRLVWVRYVVEEEGDSRGVLRREQAPYLPGVKEPEPTETTTVLRGVKDVAIAYAYLSAEAEPTVEWQETWDAKALPRGVRVAITTAPPEEEAFVQYLVNPTGRLAQVP